MPARPPLIPVRSLAASLLLAIASGAGVAQAEGANRDQLRLSDALRFVPVAGAAAYSGWRGDTPGLLELGYETVATAAATQALKYAFKDGDWGRRPDGGSKSFPSGHVSLACSGAAYLGERYGWREALPAYAVSGWVAYIRYAQDRHHIRDLVAGCGLAWGFSKLLVDEYLPQTVSLVPVIAPGRVGLEFAARW